jgi:hypothetical protein
MGIKEFIEERTYDAETAPIWERLLQGKQSHVDIGWPGKPDVRVRVCVLNSAEEQMASAGAYKRFEEIGMPINPLTVEEYNSEEVTQRLALALRDPSTGELAFDDASRLRDISTVGERLFLHAEYQALAADAMPDIDKLTEEEFARIDEAVKKKDVMSLNGFGRNALVIYLLTMAGQPSSSPTASSTPGQ